MDWRAGCAMYLCMKSSKHTPTVSFFFLFNLQYTMQKKSAILKYWWLVTVQASEEFNFSFRFQLLSEEESWRCPVSGVTSGPQFASLPAAYATGPRPRKSADDVERTWVLGGGRGAEHKLMCRPGPTAQHKWYKHSSFWNTVLYGPVGFAKIWLMLISCDGKHCSFVEKYCYLFFWMGCRRVHIFLLK